MTHPTIEALRRDTDDGAQLCAPRVCEVTLDVVSGRIVQPGDTLGWVHVLGARSRLVAPAGAPARVSRVAVTRRRAAAGYGETLLALEALDVSAGRPDAAEAATAAADGTPFEAPMDGQLYLRPSPDEPPFVADGALVQPGQTVALIEVMKFFYPIVWEGNGPIRLLRYEAADAAPIEAGQVIARLAAPGASTDG